MVEMQRGVRWFVWVLGVGIVCCLIVGALRAEESFEAGPIFGGERLVDRYQMAVVVSRAIDTTGQFREGYAASVDQLTDVPEAWRRAVALSVNTGVMSAYEGEFHGRQPMTRFQVASTIARLLERIAMVSHGPRYHQDPLDIHHSERAGGASRDAVYRDIMKPRSRQFAGSRYMVRYELAAVAARLGRHLGLAFGSARPQVADVPADHPCREDVQYAVAVGLLHTHGQGYIEEFFAEEGSPHRGHVGYVQRRRDTRLGSYQEEESVRRLHPWGSRSLYEGSRSSW